MSRTTDKARKQALDQYIGHIQFVMSDVRGRAFVWSMLDRTGLHASCMANNAGQTSFLLGRRDVGIDLLNDLKSHCFNDFRLMEDEAIARAQRLAFDREAKPPQEILYD